MEGRQSRGKVRETESWINGIVLKSWRSSRNTLIPWKSIRNSCTRLWMDWWIHTWWMCRIQIGERQSRDFSASLPHGFHEIIQKRDKTMEVMKKGVTVKGKAIYDMEVLFAWLLVIGQQRGIDLKDVFDHELSPVPPSLIDEYGCLRKGDKHCYIRKYLMAMLYVPIWS